MNPRDSIGEGLNRDLHVVRVRMNKIKAVPHDPDMPIPEDEIAAAQLSAPGIDADTDRGFLKVRIARHVHARAVERNLDQTGTIDPKGRLATPQIGRGHETLRDVHEIRFQRIR